MFKFINHLVDYDVVFLLGVLSLTGWSTTDVPMSPWYGANQTITPPPYFTTATYATAVYYYQDRVLHHQGSGVLHHQGSGVLHHQGSGVLHHQGS
jgi:hypothetical protein